MSDRLEGTVRAVMVFIAMIGGAPSFTPRAGRTPKVRRLKKFTRISKCCKESLLPTLRRPCI